MTPCFSCPSLGITPPRAAVADGLCVECGARAWVVILWRDRGGYAEFLTGAPSDVVAHIYGAARAEAMAAIPDHLSAERERIRLERARANHQVCPRGCGEHDEEVRRG